MVFCLTVLFNPFFFSFLGVFSKDIFDKDLSNRRKKLLSNKIDLSSKIFLDKDFFIINKNPELVLNKPINKKKELEIQSDEQYQEKSVIYAKGNVLATFKGNSLEADSLIYDKSNAKFDAFGNIKLIIGEQIFVAEKISYDFKSQKGKLLKVKGLIKTKNLVENININSGDPTKITSTLKKIRKVKVLHTPDGVNNWIFSTDELIVENNQWIAKRAFFTNDLLESEQVKFTINNLKITPGKEQLQIQSAISFLVLEDKIPIPFWFGKRTLNKLKDGYSIEFNSKWYIGTDLLDKDGYFIGRRLNPINLTDDFSLKLEPQYLIERSIKGYTKSFVKNGDSVTADKSRQDASLLDYFALNSNLKGKVGDWDLRVQKKLYSFDSQKFQDALRLNVDLSKEINFFKSKWNKSF